MELYYKNLLWLFTSPEKSFKRFSKDGFKRSVQVSVTIMIFVTLIQYLILIFSGELSIIASPYGWLVSLPVLILISVIILLSTTLLTSYFSALISKYFFKGRNEWLKAFTLLNYTVIIPYFFVIPIQLLYYLPFSVVTVMLFSVISLGLNLRAAGIALSKTCRISFFQGLIIYFLVNLAVSIPVTQLLLILSPV